MAECKIPVRIDGYKCVEDMIQDVLNYTYKGRTLKEWADSISKPITNADKIRSMTDEELADFLDDIIHDWGEGSAYLRARGMWVDNWDDWLRREAKDD